jgi:membrane-bound lytic murein transglycosylase B
MARGGFRARALAKGISDATYTRVMGRIRTGYDRVQADAEAAGVQRADLAIHQSPRLGLAHHAAGKEALKKRRSMFARIEQDFGVERGTLLRCGASDPRSAIPGAAGSYAADISVAGGARLERTAPPRLLGNRTDQRPEDRRSRLGPPEEMRGSWAGAMAP